MKIKDMENKEEAKSSQLIVDINVDDLRLLAIYLEGVKNGKGNLHPLGTVVLDSLWDAISYLNGHSGYRCKRVHTPPQ